MSAVLSNIQWETGNNGAQITNAGDVWRMCQVIAQSNLYPGVTHPSQAFVKAQTGAEMGFSINASMQNIHLIEGRCVLGAAMMLARVINSGIGDYEFVEWTDKICTIEWSRVKRGEWKVVGRSTWTIEEARTAGLTSRKPWINTPTDMLRSRAIGRGARSFFPDLFMGVVYDPDEARDFDGEAQRDVVTMPPRGAEAVKAHLASNVVETGVPAIVVAATETPKKSKAKEKAAGEAQGAGPSAQQTTSTSPASTVAASPAASGEQATSTPTPATPTPSPSASAPSASSAQAAPVASADEVASSAKPSASDDVVDAEVEDMPGESSTNGPTSEPQQPPISEPSTPASAPAQSAPTNDSAPASSPPASLTSIPTDIGAPSAEPPPPPSGPSGAFVEAVRTMKGATPADFATFCGSYRPKLGDDEYAALRACAIALNNRRSNLEIDKGMDDVKKAGLALVRSVPGNVIDNV